MEAKEFGRFIAGMRKEKKMTQAELAEKIHVTDKAVSRWERGLGFPDIQTIEPLAQALGISVLELMRSERQEKAKEEAAPEIQYTQKEVAEMLQNAGDISRQQKKQDRNANVIAGFLVIGVAAAAWAAKIVNVGGGLILGGLVAAEKTGPERKRDRGISGDRCGSGSVGGKDRKRGRRPDSRRSGGSRKNRTGTQT